MKFIIFIVCLFISYNSLCCSCVLGKFNKKSLKEYDLISIGVVESLKQDIELDSLKYHESLRYFENNNRMDLNEDGFVTENERNITINKLKDSHSFKIYIVEFSLRENYKGISSQKVILKTPIHDGMCGFPFQKGKEYLIFSNQGFVSNCSYTSEVDFINQRMIKKLKKWYKKD